MTTLSMHYLRRLSWLLVLLLILSVSLVWSLDENRRKSNQKSWWSELKRRLTRRRRLALLNNDDDEPGPTIVDEFLTEQEASLLLQRYEPLLRESLHFGSGTAARSQYRTSHSVRLPPNGDDLVFEIEKRAANLAGFPHSHVEDFQLACYGVDELYGLHRDDHDDPAKRADRSATVLIYLKAPIAGGSTLFTRRPIEEERDLDTKRALTTEKGALKLFREYCDHPKKKFVVVEPKVGRAATWKNWHGENHTNFCRKSTHGACPVIEGQKCVIQQWIVRTTPLPLREPRLAAIFTAGADYSFQERNVTTSAGVDSLHQEIRCLSDASTNRGLVVSSLCSGTKTKFNVLDALEGPYRGVGGLRLSGGGLSGSVPLSIIGKEGLTVSFWARKIQDGTTLLSLQDMVSIVVGSSEGHGSTQTLGLLLPGETSLFEASKNALVALTSSAQDWSWFSFRIDGVSDTAHLNIFSRSGEHLGGAHRELSHASCPDNKSEESGMLEIQLFSPPSSTNKTAFVSEHQNGAAFVAPSPAIVDVSFILIHKAALDHVDAGALRKQAARYNIDA